MSLSPHCTGSSNDGQPFMAFFYKYFLEGQLLQDDNKAKDPLRRLKGILIPAVFFHVLWWTYMAKMDLFYLFEKNYFMSITMLFGSLIAGATSEGGASVAFPVMTLAFGIKPGVARDFSFMIQSCGMTSAMFTIFYTGVKLEWNAFVYCSLGGIIGIILGLEEVAPTMTPPQKKISFVSVWFAFAFSLYWLNRYWDRKVHTEVQNFPGKNFWRAGVLLCSGFIGGIFSSVAGSGIDICSFAILTLLFRVSEKVATPTSVCLMAVNTVVGFAWRQFFQGGVAEDSWKYLAVCVPIVVFGAPIGAMLGSYCHRLVLAAFVYVTDTVQFIGAYVILANTNKLDNPLILTGVACVAVGSVLFKALAEVGQRLLLHDAAEEVELDHLGANKPASTNIGAV